MTDDVTLVCCKEMVQAQQSGTDNEGYGRLIRAERRADLVLAFIGCDLDTSSYCPWCGKMISILSLRKANA